MITLPMRFYNLIKFVLMVTLLVSLLVLLLFVSARMVSAAGPWYVSTTGNNSNNCLSWVTACQTIQGAVNKATSGDTIYISAGTFIENVYTSKSLTFIGQGADFTLVDGDDNDSVFYIDYANASFSNLTIQNGYGFIGGGGIYADGTLNLEYVNVLSNTGGWGGGGIYAGAAATLTGGRFQNNTAYNRSGGGVYANSTLTLSGTQFIGNRAPLGFAGGGIYANGAVELINGHFENNISGYTGGGLYTDSTLTINNTQFISNTAVSDGCGAYTSGSAILTDSRFESNSCTDFCKGGGLYVNGNLTLTGTQFISNTATYGGGAYVEHTATLTNGYFENNRSSQWGGGLLVWDAWAPLTLNETLFISNSASAGGGAWAMGEITLTGGRFENNQSGGSGGGLSVNNSITLTGTQFISNTAENNGGAISLSSYGNGRLVNAIFARNTASGYGEAIFSGNTAQIIHSTIASPTLGTGPAIYVYDTAHLTNTLISSYTTGIQSYILYEDYNLFHNVSTPLDAYSAVTSGGHSLTGNPTFRNPAADDYHLTLGSMAIDNGIDAGVYTDIDGEPRPQGSGYDIGAYEFSSQTPSNQAPYTPSNPNPANTSNNIPTTQTLSWYGGDPDGDVVTYTITFWTSDTPPTVETTNLTSYTPSLISGTTYYWVITATDGISESAGLPWNFTTEAVTTSDTKFVYLPLVLK